MDGAAPILLDKGHAEVPGVVGGTPSKVVRLVTRSEVRDFAQTDLVDFLLFEARQKLGELLFST